MGREITLPEPRKIDDYLVCAVVGKLVGDHGEERLEETNVFYGQDRNGRNVVLKRELSSMPDEEPADLGALLLMHEYDMHSRLKHSHICRVLDLVHDSEDRAYIVTERIGSEHFGERLHRMAYRAQSSKRAEDEMEKAIIIADTADALAYIHKKGIIHGDVKPQNIAVDEKRGYLFDLGAARKIEGEHPVLPGKLMGTPEYISKERWHGIETPSADLFALSIIAHEAFTGKHPFALIERKRKSLSGKTYYEIDYNTRKFDDEKLDFLNGAGQMIKRGLSADKLLTAEEFRDVFRELAAKHYRQPSAKTSEPSLVSV